VSTSQRVDTERLMADAGQEGFVKFLDKEGIAFSRAGETLRLDCPTTACKHKDPGDEDAAVFYGDQHGWKWKCHSCSTYGSLLDLVQTVKRIDFKPALAYVEELLGISAKPAAPGMGKVRKLITPDAEKIWEQLNPTGTPAAMDYLAGRNLRGAATEEMSLIRFAPGTCQNDFVKFISTTHPVAVPLSDVNGDIQSIVFRAITKVEGATKLNLKHCPTKGVFFGEPWRLDECNTVAVAEGMADTLALQLWAPKDVCVVGAPGKDCLVALAEVLSGNDIDVAGKFFMLFPQNDRPKNASRKEFLKLAALLRARGAKARVVATPGQFEDVAAWRNDERDAAWPEAERREPESTSSSKTIRMDAPEEIEWGANLQSLVRAFRDPEMRKLILQQSEHLRFNALSLDVVLKNGPLTDWDITPIRYQLEIHIPSARKVRFSKDDVGDALMAVARENIFNPIQDYLNGLQWDGVSRLGPVGVINKVLGRDGTELETAFIRKFMVAAVARAMAPGCKFDSTLIMTGPGESYKSTFCRVLAGDDYFRDSHIDINTKDGLTALKGNWIIEWSELTAVKRAKDQDTIKSYLSATVDKYRPPYGRTDISVPRACVIVGTTNDSEFLSDPTGNRRYWPLTLKGNIDIAWVVANRDQLWAEAVSIFKTWLAGRPISHCYVQNDPTKPWLLTKTEQQLQAPEARKYELSDEWEDEVRGRVAKLPRGFSIREVLVDIGKQEGHITRADEMRMGKVLRTLRFTKRQDGHGRNRWFPLDAA